MSGAPDWQALIEALPNAVWVVEAESQRVIAANAVAARLLGCEPRQLVDHTALALAATPEDLCFGEEASAGARAPLASDSLVRRFDGTTVPVTRHISPVARAGRTFFVVSLQDRSAQLRTERDLELAAAELAATLESTADGILVTDLAGRIRHCNRRLADLWGLPEDLLLSRDDDAVLEWMRRSVPEPSTYVRRLATIEEATLLQASDVLALHSGKVLERIALPQCSRGRPIGRVFSFRDITDRLAAKQRFEKLSHSDPLTGLPNRALLAERVERALAQSGREGAPFALLLLNLDHFKHTNETLGHAVADRVLIEIGERLAGSVRQIDTVARLGGDEFVLLAQRSDATGAEAAARRVMEALLRPFTLDGMNFTVTASLGIALHRCDGGSLDELLRRAARVLRDSGLPGRWLELELTESILIEDVEGTLERLHALASLGVQLAIDDFGTGHSSLGYLKRLPIGGLKIDRSFVTDLPGDAGDACIVNAVVNLGRALGLQVIAEGVETEAQRQFLLRSGCHDFQGFLFAPALAATNFEALLPPPADHWLVALHRRRTGEGRDYPAAALGD